MLLSSVPSSPAIYVRWSTDEQGSGTTLEEQKQTCLNFMAERGWPVRPDLLFIDDGYSAGSLERPGMQKLRALVMAGAVDAVIVYKLDRLTRNIVDAVDLVLREWEARCALVSVTQSAIDTTNALGRQFFTLMASFAEFEREMIRDRTLSGKKRRAMQGRNPGFRAPYGYCAGENPGDIVVDVEKAEVVRRIFDLFVSGISMLNIARHLNKEALPCPGTAPGWHDRTIRYMLLNPAYVGRLEYGRTSVNSPQKKKIVGRYRTIHKAPRWAVVPDAFPAIVPYETWSTVQSMIQQRSRKAGFKARAASSSYLLTGLLKCRCGYACAGVTAKGVDYYRCRSGTGLCKSGYIRADSIDRAVLEAVRGQVRARMGNGILEAVATKVEAARKAAGAAVVNLQGVLATILKQREKARKDYMAGEITGKIFTGISGDLDTRESDARAALLEAEYVLSKPMTVGIDSAWLMSNMDQIMSDTWDKLGMGQKKHTLRTLVSRMVAYREGKEPTVDLEVTLASLEEASTNPVQSRKELVV